MSGPDEAPVSGDGDSGVFALIVDRPVAVLMIFLAAAVFGLVSYSQLPLNLMPDISYPTLTVRTEFPGAAPEEVESQVSRPIEEALSTVDGLVEIESRSRAESSDVVLEFDWGTDMDSAAQSLRERLQTTWLGEGVQRPLILRYDPSLDPILRVAVSLEGEERDVEEALFLLRDIAEREIKPELEAMEGVAAVRVRGGLERQILVEVREDWLAAREVTLDQVRSTLLAENVNLAGGKIAEGETEFLIRTLNELEAVSEVEDLNVLRSDGTRVRIGELAKVSEAPRDREVISHLDGAEAVELEVFKEADANIVSVARSVKQHLGQGPQPELPPGLPPEVAEQLRPKTLADELPEDVALAVLDDQAAFIEAAVNNLRSTAIFGGVLAVAVLFLFLRNVRVTAIIATAIPISIIVTFAALYLGGVSLNLMSLGGLALGVGMLVDNAVVVLESIQVQLEKGMGRRESAVVGAREVAAAVTASTLTTVAVFFPIGFVEGIGGQVFGDLATAVVFSLLASLIVALIFVPMLAARSIHIPTVEGGVRELARPFLFGSWPELKASVVWDRERAVRWLLLPYQLGRFVIRLLLELLALLFVVPLALGARASAWVADKVLPRAHGAALWAADRFGGTYDRVAARYPSVLRGAMARPARILGWAAFAFAVSLAGLGLVGEELIPSVHQGRFTVETALPVGTPLSRNAAVLAEVERILMADDEIETVYAAIGSERRADADADEGEHTARVLVQLTPGGDLEARQDRVSRQIRDALKDFPDLSVRIVSPALFSFRTPVEVVITGQDLALLRGLSDEALWRLSRVPGLKDLSTSLARGYPEVRVHYDRRMIERYNLSTAQVAGAVRDKIQGTDAGKLARGERRVDLVLRLREGDRSTLDDLQRININPALDPPIPLSAVATLTEGEGPSEIRRVDQQRAAVISANLEGFDLASSGAAIAGALAGMDWPAGYDFEVAGQTREMERSLSSLGFALLLAVFLVYVIMASTFESTLHPLVILVSLPLAAVGVIAALVLTATSLSVVAFIGLIVLAGVVVNNAIVLVDYINRLREQGVEREAAIRQAGSARLRPILITTTTTVLGLAPLALGLGEGSEIQQPLALTVIAGLLSSTLLTLVVIPVVYQVLTGLMERRPAEAPADGAGVAT
jgi:HAE1 family hydrophobic/amphiphilic exporter-1